VGGGAGCAHAVLQPSAFIAFPTPTPRRDPSTISPALAALGVVVGAQTSPDLRAQLAADMFDTRGKVDPFGKSAPLKRAAVEQFPGDMFFVLRVVQLLRGIAQGMGINDFSSAKQWAPLARDALRIAQQQKQQQAALVRRKWRQGRFVLSSSQAPWLLQGNN